MWQVQEPTCSTEREEDILELLVGEGVLHPSVIGDGLLVGDVSVRNARLVQEMLYFAKENYYHTF